MLDAGIHYNPSIWKAEAGGWQLVQGQCVLCRESDSHRQSKNQS